MLSERGGVRRGVRGGLMSTDVLDLKTIIYS
jgi:hypothetical protein